MMESKQHSPSPSHGEYFALMPFILALDRVIGWILAARALAPVARWPAQPSRIRGSNLRCSGFRPRGAGRRTGSTDR